MFLLQETSLRIIESSTPKSSPMSRSLTVPLFSRMSRKPVRVTISARQPTELEEVSPPSFTLVFKVRA